MSLTAASSPEADSSVHQKPLLTRHLQASFDLLKRLLHKNRHQHRRGRYFKELDMLRNGISRLLIRQSMFQQQEVQDADSSRTVTPSSSSSLSRSSATLLVTVKQAEHLGLLVAKCASSLTALMSRTHFMPFSLTMLTILARLRLLLAQLLSDKVHQYNQCSSNSMATISTSNTILPEFLRLDLEHKPYPKVQCHFGGAIADKSLDLVEQGMEVGKANKTNDKHGTMALSHTEDFGTAYARALSDEEEDFEEAKHELPVVDDQDQELGNTKKNKHWKKRQQKEQKKVTHYRKIFGNQEEVSVQKIAALELEAVISPSIAATVQMEQQKTPKAGDDVVGISKATDGSGGGGEEEKQLQEKSRFAFLAVGPTSSSPLNREAKEGETSQEVSKAPKKRSLPVFRPHLASTARDSQTEIDDIFSMLGGGKKKKKRKAHG